MATIVEDLISLIILLGFGLAIWAGFTKDTFANKIKEIMEIFRRDKEDE